MSEPIREAPEQRPAPYAAGTGSEAVAPPPSGGQRA